MPISKLKEPCKQCPWRRNSWPGWLGASSPEEFAATTLSETHMPCHVAIDYEDPYWRTTQLPTVPLCYGALVFMRNTCKIPRDLSLVTAMVDVVPDRKNIFCFPQEFIDYHSKPLKGAP